MAVNTFRNSGDPVKMVVRRSVRKLVQAATGDRSKTNFLSKNKNNEKSNDVVEDVFRDEKENRINMIHKTVASPSENIKTKSTANGSINKRGWFSPQEISASSELSSGTDVLIASLDEQRAGKLSSSDGKEEYDSAYDTLMTNKSSRTITSSSSVTVADRISSDVESTTTTTTSNTECTLAANDNDNNVRRRQNTTKNHTTTTTSREQQRDSARENSSDSEKRRSTFFIIPERENGIKTPTDEFNNNPAVLTEADFDYEYKVSGFSLYSFISISLIIYSRCFELSLSTRV